MWHSHSEFQICNGIKQTHQNGTENLQQWHCRNIGSQHFLTITTNTGKNKSRVLCLFVADLTDVLTSSAPCEFCTIIRTVWNSFWVAFT